MKHLLTCARSGLLALAVLLMGSVLWSSPAAAHRGDTTTPTPVTVAVEFTDNACVGSEYVAPAMDAPVVPGTTDVIIGAVAPGETVQVIYTALEGFVIVGPSSFTHTFPAEPSSATDCRKTQEPEPQVRDRVTVRTDCDGVERREWQVVTAYVWNGSEWVLGEPQVRNDSGWMFVRALTPVERSQLGCLEVKGQQETSPDQGDKDEPEVTPTAEVEPTRQTVPTGVDAGLSDAVAPAGPRWLAPLLGGVIVLGLAAFSRLKALADQT